MSQIKDTEAKRIKFILSYANIFTLCFSVLYSCLLMWGYFQKIASGSQIKLFPIYFSVIVPVLFLTAYILNLKDKSNLSKFILASSIITLNFIAGIWWGFDLPSVLLSYLFCIVILALTSHAKENVIYTSVLILSIFIGSYLRTFLDIQTTWRESRFGTNDIIEFSIMFIFISFLLIKFNQEQNKTLKRASRAENILTKERDSLEQVVREKTNEIKQMQMEEISKMYHLIEFGKLSSGLYHDLITPIQTMSLYIERLVRENIVKDDRLSRTISSIKLTHDSLSVMLENIRKQISIKVQDEKFNLVTEINDLVNLVRNNYFKNNVGISIKYESILDQTLNTKRSVVNHIALNLISNAYEACIEDKKYSNKEYYEIEVKLGKHENKNYISVSDNGIGIKDEDLEKIFDHFYSSKNKDTHNCGVGLSSSRYYAEKYINGKIFVESEYGEGTTMTLLF